MMDTASGSAGVFATPDKRPGLPRLASARVASVVCVRRDGTPAVGDCAVSQGQLTRFSRFSLILAFLPRSSRR